MSQISDPVLSTIADGFSTGGLPKSIAKAIFDIARLLRASRSLEDISVFAQIRPLPNGRFTVSATGKWAISFQLMPGIGPSDLRLEKQGKSWSEKRNRSSRPNRQGKS